MKNIIQLLAIVTLIITASCGEGKKEISDNREAISVTVSAPSFENNGFIAASGKIEAVQNANISTRMMGYINNIPVKVGDKVSKGQLLVSINSADINAQKAQVNASITEATAAFKNAEKDYNRFKALYEDKSASQKEMDDMTAHYEMAKARLEAATQMKNQVNAQLSYSNITAPFSGVVTGKYAKKGDMANPGMPLLSIENPSNFEVTAMVPESEITQIKKGSKAKVIVKSTNEIVSGTVTEVSSSAANTGGQYLVKVQLDKTDKSILSGMFVNVQFEAKSTSPKTKIIVPESAIITQGQLKGVYTVANNTAILRWIRTGKDYGDNVEVLSGLSPDEQYIVSANGKLYNGAKISIQ